jgi:hypothetical protein
MVIKGCLNQDDKDLAVFPETLKAALADRGHTPDDFIYRLSVAAFAAGRRQGVHDLTGHPVGASGVQLIAAERERQVTVENWTPEHDDTHDTGGLTCAAMAYADAARKRMLGASDEHTLRIWNYWRWNKDWWKPSLDPVRNLVKAGALIAAEIDRLHRKENKNV